MMVSSSNMSGPLCSFCDSIAIQKVDGKWWCGRQSCRTDEPDRNEEVMKIYQTMSPVEKIAFKIRMKTNKEAAMNMLKEKLA